MSERAQILRIVVASPGDVNAERDLVPRVVDELNMGIAADRGLRLDVIRWETDTYPGFHPEGPQGLIDTILRIDDCDVVIGIFWKRFGTPTKEGTTGTEHEIRRAYDAWQKQHRPQVMVYFNQKPSAPQSEDQAGQWGQVLRFREQFPREGLWWPYKGTREFERLLRLHLTNFIRDKFRIEAARPPVLKGEDPSGETALAPGTRKTNPKDGLRYLWIPPGTFQMGCSTGDVESDEDEKPAHEVTISKGFWMGQTPVTVAAYKRFVSEMSGEMPPAPKFNEGWSNQRMPVVHVTWHDALAYCVWAGGRLPTEAEWEYAARAGSTEASCGPLDESAPYEAHDVGQKLPNRFGLYDMVGNVDQWVNDWYDDHYYEISPSVDPPGPSEPVVGYWSRVVRGDRTATGRDYVLPDAASYDCIGFRCALEVMP